MLQPTNRTVEKGVGVNNTLAAALDDDGVAIGTIIHLSDPAIVEIAALAGFDWVSFSFEHSALSAADIEALQRAADVHGLTTLLHLTDVNDPRLLSMLHAGIGGICLQQATTPEQAEQLVRFTRFPPLGERGAHAGVRADRYGSVDYDEFMETANRSFVAAVAIEDLVGVENADEMLSVPGLSAVFVGLHDLSHSVGTPNDLRSPAVLEALATVTEAARRNGVPLGLPGYAHTAGELRELGARLIISGSENTLFRSAMTDLVQRWRTEVEHADAVASG
jgi:4-hydroxy-2-oxoheptanedioate aldolase